MDIVGGVLPEAGGGGVVGVMDAISWVSQNPAFARLGVVMGEYVARFALSSCLSKGACTRCQRCLHFLGVHMEAVGAADVLRTGAVCAYSSALRNPMRVLRGMEGLMGTLRELGEMPALRPEGPEHAELADAAMQSDATVHSVLAAGQRIYPRGGGAWLTPALPEILHGVGEYLQAQMRQRLQTTQGQLRAAFVEHVARAYERWRGIGHEHAEAVEAAHAQWREERQGGAAVAEEAPSQPG